VSGVLLAVGADSSRADLAEILREHGLDVLEGEVGEAWWTSLEEHAPSVVIVAGGDADEVLEVVEGLASVIVVGPAEASSVERWWTAGAFDYAPDPLGADAPRLRAACRRALELSSLRKAGEGLAVLARLALDPPGRRDLPDRLSAELEAVGVAAAWQVALVEEGRWRLAAGRWPEEDAWTDPVSPSSARPRVRGDEVVVALGPEGAPAGALRVRLAGDPSRIQVGLVRALGALAGASSGPPPVAPVLASDDRLGAALHELRGPLTALLGQGQLIERGLLAPVEEPVREAAEVIVGQARRLRALIDAMDPRQDC